MKRMNLSMLACMLATVLIPLLLTTPVAQAASAVTCPGWNLIASPNAGPYSNQLSSVAAASANDVWALGYSTSVGTLVEHWDGTSWSVIPISIPGQLYGVAAVSTNDVWAVGDQSTSSGTQTLIEHWNGTSWSVVPSPNTGSDGLGAVAAVSTNDVWAVGSYETTTDLKPQTLTEHWNGTSWSIVPSPNTGSIDGLGAVAAVSATDVWAVGYYETSDYLDYPLIEHWNGTSWNIVPSPNIGSFNVPGLRGVAAVSTNDVWAVGAYATSSGTQTLIEHWNGTSWNIVPSPNVGLTRNNLLSVVAVSTHNVWAVGSDSDCASYRCHKSQTLIEHWNGSSWKVVTGATVGGAEKQLNGIARVPGTSQLWAVGARRASSQPSQTLTEFHC